MRSLKQHRLLQEDETRAARTIVEIADFRQKSLVFPRLPNVADLLGSQILAQETDIVTILYR